MNSTQQDSRKIKFYGKRDPEVILRRALRTLGPEKRFVTWMACTNSELNFPPGSKDLRDINMIQWIRLSSFLGIPKNVISLGYSRLLHTHGLFESISNGTYILPRNKNYRVIKRAMKRRAQEDRLFEKTYFGRRLYLKVRFQQLQSDTRKLPRFTLNLINSEITLLLSRITYRRLTSIYPYSDTNEEPTMVAESISIPET